MNITDNLPQRTPEQIAKVADAYSKVCKVLDESPDFPRQFLFQPRPVDPALIKMEQESLKRKERELQQLKRQLRNTGTTIKPRRRK